jgi:hypothetical protein
VVEACCALWDCWQESAVFMDKEGGFFIDPEKVRYADYEGRYVRTRGPADDSRAIRRALGADVGRLVRAAAILLRAGPKRSSSQTAFTAGALNVG